MKVRADKTGIPPLRALRLLCREQPGVEAEILAWSKDGSHTNPQIRSRIKERWGIALGNDSALSDFWRLQEVRSSFSTAAAMAEEAMDMLRTDLPPEKVSDLGRMVFERAAMKSGDADTFVNLRRLKLKEETAKTKADLENRKLALAERRVQLMEKKLERAAQIVKTAQEKGGMTAETLAKLEKELRML